MYASHIISLLFAKAASMSKFVNKSLSSIRKIDVRAEMRTKEMQQFAIASIPNNGSGSTIPVVEESIEFSP